MKPYTVKPVLNIQNVNKNLMKVSLVRPSPCMGSLGSLCDEMWFNSRDDFKRVNKEFTFAAQYIRNYLSGHL